MHRALLVLVILGCGSSPPPAKPAPPPPAPAPAPAPAPPAITFPGAPDTPAGKELAWALDVIAHHGGKVEQAELAKHFHASFLAQVPIEQVGKVFDALATQLGDIVLVDVKGDANLLVAHATGGGAKLVITLALDPASHQITGLLFKPDPDALAMPKSWDEAIAMTTALAPRAQLLVAALDKGACTPVHELAAKDELALGSTFKLYVLLALVDRIAAGKLAWDGELAVRDDWKSLPGGITQNDPAGTKLSIRTLAERMISISDNTATDHLLYTVGRDNVEAALRSAKHAKPQLDRPFLSTRELFVFRLSTAPAELAKYLAMPEAKRRAYLDKTVAGSKPDLAGVAAWTGARGIDKIEWFASAEDLCRVMDTLRARSKTETVAPLLDVLAKNPGVGIDKQAFPYAGFKGGSEPGVINLTFLLRRADEKWFVVVLGANAAEGGTVDEQRAAGIAQGVIALLGKER